MKMRNVLLVGVVLLLGTPVFAQEYAKWEIPVNYTYARGNPANVAKPFSLNGGGGALVYNFNRYIGVKGDLQGYGSTTSTFNNVVVVNPNGTPTTISHVSAQGNLFTYMAGPQFRLPTHTIKPFGELLFGGAQLGPIDVASFITPGEEPVLIEARRLHRMFFGVWVLAIPILIAGVPCLECTN